MGFSFVAEQGGLQAAALTFAQGVVNAGRGVGAGAGFAATAGVEQNGSSGKSLQGARGFASALDGLHPGPFGMAGGVVDKPFAAESSLQGQLVRQELHDVALGQGPTVRVRQLMAGQAVAA